LTQRAAILTALSMAARETAGFSTLPRPNIPKRVDFPSKVLPPALHDRYLTEQDVRGASHAGLLLQAGKEDVVDLVLKKKGTARDVSAPRQRQLRAGTTNGRSTTTTGLNAIGETGDAPIIPFQEVAAEYFILPMINRFWTYFQDELARETRAPQSRRGQAIGTGMILSPLAMSHFISALTIMLHAARHSPVYLAVLAPEALELAIAVGTQLAVARGDADNLSPASPHAELETNVVAASLELALVCLTGSKELDGGRSLIREHMASVMASAEWASGLFGKEQKGESTSSHKGGLEEDRIRRTAASVVLTVHSIVEAVQGQLPLAVSQMLAK
jgi:telomere length regulation protein